jgi:protein-S-isoprenylcysteine O-methyltransferase Ste14
MIRSPYDQGIGMSDTSLFIFIICTAANGIFTWKFSITAKRPHGIPRFLSFECILLLVLLNAQVWFERPFMWNQVVSWILLFASILFAVTGFFLLRLVGKPKGDFENTSKLVVVGLYRFIRHPLYASLILLGFGVYFKCLTILTTVIAVINFIALIVTAKKEEQEMLEKFGLEYIEYMSKTKMFIPYIF